MLPHPATISLTIDDISDKLAADVRFMELIKSDLLIEKKMRSLSLEDKKMFLKFAEEKKISMMLKLYAKGGVDFENYVSTKASILKNLNKDYGLDKRSDRIAIINSALIKLKTPFADCLALYSSLMGLCGEFYIWYYDFDFGACFAAATAAWLACLWVLD